MRSWIGCLGLLILVSCNAEDVRQVYSDPEESEARPAGPAEPDWRGQVAQRLSLRAVGEAPAGSGRPDLSPAVESTPVLQKRDVLTRGGDAIFESLIDFRGDPEWKFKPQYLAFQERALPVRIGAVHYSRRLEKDPGNWTEDSERRTARFDDSTGTWYIPFVDGLVAGENWNIDSRTMNWLLVDLLLADGTREVVHVGFRARGTVPPYRHAALQGTRFGSSEEIAMGMARTMTELLRDRLTNTTPAPMKFKLQAGSNALTYRAGILCLHRYPHNVKEEADYYAQAPFGIFNVMIRRIEGEKAVTETLKAVVAGEAFELEVAPGETVEVAWITERTPEGVHCHGLVNNYDSSCRVIGGSFAGKWTRSIDLLLTGPSGKEQVYPVAGSDLEVAHTFGRFGAAPWRCQGTL